MLASLVLITMTFRSGDDGPLAGVQSASSSALKPFAVGFERVAQPFRDAYGWVDSLLTARSDRQSFIEGMEAGADDFLTKPFDQDQLFARLRVAERIMGMHEELQRLSGLLPICSFCKRIRDGDAPAHGSPPEWVPIESVRCRYIGEWVATKSRWGLSVDQKEREHLLRYASDCPNARLAYAVAE